MCFGQGDKEAIKQFQSEGMLSTANAGVLLFADDMVEALQMNILRQIKGVSRLDRVRNVDIRESYIK